MQTCNICYFSDNPIDAKFCIECGKALPKIAYTGATSNLTDYVPYKPFYPMMMSGVLNEVMKEVIAQSPLRQGALSRSLTLNNGIEYELIDNYDGTVTAKEKKRG